MFIPESEDISFEKKQFVEACRALCVKLNNRIINDEGGWKKFIHEECANIEKDIKMILIRLNDL